MKLEWDKIYTEKQRQLLDTHSWIQYKYATGHIYEDIPDMICERCDYRADTVGAFESKTTYGVKYHHKDVICSCNEWLMKQVLE